MMLGRMLLNREARKRCASWVNYLWLVILVMGMLLIPQDGARAATLYGPVVVRPGGAQLYDVPDGAVIATLPTSTVFTARGRTADELWVVGETVVGDADGDGIADGAGEQGWLQVAQVIAIGVELLPVVDDTESAAAVVAAVTNGAATDDATAMPTTPDMAATTHTVLLGMVASGDDRLNVRGGPGTAYAIVAKARSGESYPVVGRTEDATWLQIDRDGDLGWVSAEFLVVEGDVSTLPVVITPATAAPTTRQPSTTQPSVQTPAPSGTAVPDLRGTLVIESSRGGMIYGYALASGAQWPLTHGFDPAISPDGQTVAFVRDGGEQGLYLIDIDGRNERLIFSGRTRLSSPKWSPDGQWILFTRGDEEYHCMVFGSGCVTPPSAPDGREITIPGAEMATRYWYQLARVDRDGNNYRDIASLTSARAADWNEAGIVYQSDAGLQMTADAPDGENTLVIFDYLKPFFFDPDWQPQGGRIVYMGKEASHWEIFAVNPDGSGKVALTRPATTVVDAIPSNVAPVWSPDGEHIAFLSNRDEEGEAGAWRVWVMDADGSNPRVLPFDVEIYYTFGNEQSISWAQ